MSTRDRSERTTIQKKPCQYRLNERDLYRCISYEALRLETVEKLVSRTWDSICDDAIIFAAGHYDRYTGKTAGAIPYIDPDFRFKRKTHLRYTPRADDMDTVDVEKKIAERLLNQFALDHKGDFDPTTFTRILQHMILRICIRHFNTINQNALADAMSAELCPIKIHWYDDMVLLEITDGRESLDRR